jgi:enamine deaminase RidA (YjgF/YER057c/UK114 family)
VSATRRHGSGTPWEDEVGYCRALRRGDVIVVSGTLGVDGEGRPAGDAHGQARAALDRIVAAVEALGGRREDIVRTRMFATAPSRDWAALARAHREVFAAHPPASTLVGTSGLVVPGCVVEIEADALLEPGAR